MDAQRFLIALCTVVFIASCSKDEVDDAAQNADNASEKSAVNTAFVTTSEAYYFTNLFNTSGGGWTGGDGAYSIPLPDGRVLWTFGDSFLGTVNPNYSRPGTPMLNNTFVLQDGNEITTLHGGTPNNPQAYVVPDNPNHWYWPGDGTVIGNKLYMFMLRLRNNGTGGIWSFEHIGSDLAIFSLPNIELLEIKEVVRSTEYLMGVSIYEEESYIYSYSTRTTFGKLCLASRLHVDNPNQVEHWNGSAWGSNFVGDAYLKRGNGNNLGVSNMFSVFKKGDKYHLLNQQDFFGAGIELYSSDSPVGPWTSPIIVYETPESGGNIFTYNATCHTHIEHPTKGMLVTYSVNSLNFGDIFSDVRNYRPRFFWLKEAE